MLSILTGRYSSSPESQIDKDIKVIYERPFSEFLADIEAAELSDGFWNVGLVQRLNTSSVNSLVFKVFLAAQARLGDQGFLSKDISVRDMLIHHGDIHHIFPRNYLKKAGMARGRYNQVANFVYVQQEVNIKIGDRAPTDYLASVIAQCETGSPIYGAITDPQVLGENLQANCLPERLDAYELDNYENFLQQRRQLMAQKIKIYYQAL